MQHKNRHKINFDRNVFFSILAIIFFVLTPNSIKAQTTDTVFLNTSKTYRVRNQQDNSWLYWEVVGGEIQSENPTQTDSVVVKWTVSGIGTLSVYEKSALNCRGDYTNADVFVKINDADVELDVPNIFTPNEDGLNDYFAIGYNIVPENFKIIIYNRWGKIVFENQDIDNSWNGKNGRNYCKSGVYYYVIRYDDKGETEILKGSLFLNAE